MTSHIPDPTQPDRVAIAADGGLAYGVHIAPARTDGSAPTLAELDAAVHVGWASADQFQLGGRGATCPECEQGKCRNCDGTAWDDDADTETTCTCPHQEA